jgi:hypothetical protein
MLVTFGLPLWFLFYGLGRASVCDQPLPKDPQTGNDRVVNFLTINALDLFLPDEGSVDLNKNASYCPQLSCRWNSSSQLTTQAKLVANIINQANADFVQICKVRFNSFL